MSDPPSDILSKFASDDISNRILAEQVAQLYKISRERTLTKSELQSLKTAQQMLKERKSAALEQAAAPSQASRAFENVITVVAYLQDSGWKVKKSTVYNHIKQRKLTPTPEGAYLATDVDRYAGLYLPRLDGAPARTEEQNVDRIQRETLEAKLKIAQEQARHWEKRNRDLEAELQLTISRDLAARLRFFKSDIENFIRGEAQSVITLVAGDLSKAPEYIAYHLDQLDIWLARYADDREITIPPLPEPQEETAA